MNDIVPGAGTNALMPRDMDQAIRMAKAMSSTKLVPKHLREDPGACLMIVEQAARWNMSPFAVAQCTSLIGEKLMYEGKLIAAAVASMGAITSHFDYKYEGAGEDRKVTVSAIRAGEKEPRTIEAVWKDVKTTNDFWKKQPDQQLAYAGTRIWARRWAPAALLGVYAPEEFDRTTGQIISDEGPVIEHEPEAPSPREQINAEVPIAPPESTPKGKGMTARVWLDAFEQECADATNEDQANAVLEKALQMEDWLRQRPAAFARYETIKAGMLSRIYTVPPDEDSAAEPVPDEVGMQIARMGA
jgi:hypothetical protein